MDDKTEKDENKTNAELLKEVKKLREETEKDNKKKWQNSTYNTMIVIGLILLAIYFFVKCAI
jgi:flagellar biogenesis protein FliO